MRYCNVLWDNGLQTAMPSVCLIREHGANEIATVESVRSALDGAVSHERSQLPRNTSPRFRVNLNEGEPQK